MTTRRDFLALSAALIAARAAIEASNADSQLLQKPLPKPPWPVTGGRPVVLRLAGSGPFCVGQAFRKGDFPDIVSSIGQVTVKNRWSDGSVKFAVVAGVGAGSVTFTAGSAPQRAGLSTANLKATGVTATIGCDAFGAVVWSSSDWDLPFSTWIVGPEMSSWIYRKAIDQHLVAWLEVRLYAGGAVEVLPWVENGFLNVPNPTSKGGAYIFTLGGAQRFGQTFDLPHHCRTPLVSGVAVAHWLGTAFDVTPAHDLPYLMETGLVPAYRASVSPTAPIVAALPGSYTPLQLGSFPATGLGSGGYHSSIGLLPEWDVLYLTTPAPAAYKGVVFNGYSAGRYPFHYRDESTNAPPKPSTYPSLTIMPPTPGWPTTPGATGTAPDAWSYDHQPSVGFMPYLITGRFYFKEEIQLSATTNFMSAPYTWRQGTKGIFDSRSAGAVRGVAWQLRTLAQAICATPDDEPLRADLIAQLGNNVDFYSGRMAHPQGFVQPYSDYNGGTGGVTAAGSTTTLVKTADGPYGYQYTTHTEDNQYIGWDLTIGSETRRIIASDAKAYTLTVSAPFSQAPVAGIAYGMTDRVFFESTWMQDFLTAALGYAIDLDSAPDRTKLRTLFEWKARSIVGRFGGAGSTEYLYCDANPYAIAIAPSDRPDYDTGAGPWYPDWGAIYAATWSGKTLGDGKPPPYAALGARVEGPLRGWLSPEGQWANLQPALAYAVKHGAAGAALAYQRMTGASNWTELAVGFNSEPVWGVAPSVAGVAAAPAEPASATVPPPVVPPPITTANPAWAKGQSVNEWREIPGSSMSACPPRNTAYTTFHGAAVVGAAAKMSAWCGLSVDTRTSTVWSAANGGHGDYFGNEVNCITLETDAPKWIERLAGSSGDVVNLVSNPIAGPSVMRYTDGLPASTHSYYGQQFIERHNRALRLGGSIAPYGSAYENVEAFNISAGSWDPLNTYPGIFGMINGGWTPAINWGTCKDPGNEYIYVTVVPSLRRFKPSSSGVGGVWDSLCALPKDLNSGANCATAVDTKRNRMLWTHGFGLSPQTCDLSSGVWTRQTYSGSAVAAFVALQTNLGLTYVPYLDAFFARGGAAGATVFVINAGTFEVSRLAANTPAVPQGGGYGGQYENVLNRWLFVPNLRGIVYFPAYTANAWFLRLY